MSIKPNFDKMCKYNTVDGAASVFNDLEKQIADFLGTDWRESEKPLQECIYGAIMYAYLTGRSDQSIYGCKCEDK